MKYGEPYEGKQILASSACTEQDTFRSAGRQPLPLVINAEMHLSSEPDCQLRTRSRGVSNIIGMCEAFWESTASVARCCMVSKRTAGVTLSSVQHGGTAQLANLAW